MKIVRGGLLFAVMAALPVCLQAQFRFQDQNGKSLELLDHGAPVFVYNYGVMLKEGVPADRARCCYVHPVYAPNGVVLTDDFPVDHYHHRGINWMWPIVKVQGKTYDLWSIQGIHARFGRWIEKSAGTNKATLAVENNWWADGKKVVREQVFITAHPVADGKRQLDFVVKFRGLVDGVEIGGTHDHNKGYGGFNMRFAPREETRIETPDQKDAPDSDLKPEPWEELTANFSGKRAGARITIDPSNPGYPNGWCLRHYGFLGVNFPGLQLYTLPTTKDLTMKFTVTLLGSLQ